MRVMGFFPLSGRGVTVTFTIRVRETPGSNPGAPTKGRTGSLGDFRGNFDKKFARPACAGRSEFDSRHPDKKKKNAVLEKEGVKRMQDALNGCDET